jgi:hypothetical protein
MAFTGQECKCNQEQHPCLHRSTASELSRGRNASVIFNSNVTFTAALLNADTPSCKPLFLNRRAAARYTGPREVLLEVLILVFYALFMNEYFIVEITLRRVIFVDVSKRPDPERLNNICATNVSD